MEKRIISVVKLLENGATFKMIKGEMQLKIGNITIEFNTNEESNLRYLSNIKMNEEVETVMSKVKKIDINEAHDVMRHLHKDQMEDTVKIIGMKLTGELHTCEGCMQAKAKYKAVNKTTNRKSTKPGERLYIDISGPYQETLKGNRYWVKMVDDYRRFSTSTFIKHKNELKYQVIKHIKIINSSGKKVMYVRLDNSGENIGELKDICEE